ncbi:MAG: twin-arginine translocation signal domain-containing protein [Anaerolineae bacterium]|nr:twin-arginine translocation signal domain-containing protein [Anaerolineae bacterium]
MEGETIPSTPLSRRKFLKISALTLAAASLACCGVSLVTSFDTVSTPLPSLSFGDKTMQKSVLVGYASTFGTTAEAAVEIGRILAERGFAVDVCPVQTINTLAGYERVVLGSAVHGGLVLAEMSDFIQANQSDLLDLPMALFCVGLAKNLAYLDSIKARIRPESKAAFTGRLVLREGITLIPGLSEKPALRGAATMMTRLIPPLDYRKPQKVRDWAQTLFV